MTVCAGSHEKPTVVYALNRGQVRLVDGHPLYRWAIWQHAGRSFFIGYEGECGSCGHNYSLNGDMKIRHYQTDGCTPGLYRVDCIRGQRPERQGYSDTTKKGAIVLNRFLPPGPPG